MLFEFAQQNLVLISVFFGLSTLLVIDLLSAARQRYASVDPLAASALLSHQDAVVLDVREPSEFREGHILNARHIPLGQLSNRLGELEKFKTRTLIVNCRMGQRSASACHILHKAGFTQIHNLRGGIEAWRGASLPVVKK